MSVTFLHLCCKSDLEEDHMASGAISADVINTWVFVFINQKTDRLILSTAIGVIWLDKIFEISFSTV